MTTILTVAGVTAILVTVLTLLFQYLPGLRVKWAALSTEIKKVIVLVLYLLVGAFIAFGGCWSVIAALLPQLLCSTALGFGQYAIAVLIAVGAGQGIFDLLPELKEVSAIKAERVY